MTAHAKLSPSAAHRWLDCPGSIRMSQGMENKSGVFAAEGSAAHALAAHCLESAINPDALIGWGVDSQNGDLFDEKCSADEIDGERVFEVTEEMAEAVQTYVDTCRLYMGKGWEFEIEQKLDLRSVHPDVFGTGDFIAYHAKTRSLEVIDYKHGKGVPVDVDANPQLFTYALGAAIRYHNRGVDKVTLTIVQPRCPHKGGPVRSVEYDILDLLEFRTELAAGAKATEAPDAPLHPGEHCKFCPAAGICPALRDKVIATAEAEFGEPVVAMDSDQLARVMEQKELIKDWIKRVEEFAQSEAQHGRLPTGWKLVAKRATRKWKNAEAAKIALTTILELDEEQIYGEPKMKSPAQIETVIGKKRKAEIADLWESVSSGTNLVPESDERPDRETGCGKRVRVTHVCGGGEVEALIAPNRYRKLFSEHPKTDETLKAEKADALRRQKQEWPNKSDRALGIGLCLCFEPILQWDFERPTVKPDAESEFA